MSYYSCDIHFIFELEIQARYYFPKASFHLEVSTSPEDGSKELLFIVTHPPGITVEDSIAQMDKFTNEWYLRNGDRASDLLVITEYAEES